MDVVMVPWPTQEVHRSTLSSVRRPRLLLVDPDVPAPRVTDVLEDWVRLPANDEDVQARVATLAARSESSTNGRPGLDADGVLRYDGELVALPPLEARLASLLLERFAAVVSRDGLGRAGWPEGPPGRNALDVHMVRLRRRVQPLGLSIKTVRGRGYLLAGSSSGAKGVT
ncbi:MAG: helix-turn-helix domain-containing protein [Acidimicrobiales bacterium]